MSEHHNPFGAQIGHAIGTFNQLLIMVEAIGELPLLFNIT